MSIAVVSRGPRSLGRTPTATTFSIGIREPAVTRAAYRGEAIAAADSLEPVESKNA
jgi:hypothetical protein